MAIGVQDPAWQLYESQSQHPGKGKGPPHSPVPEPAATGALLVGLVLSLVAVLRWRASRLRRAQESLETC